MAGIKHTARLILSVLQANQRRPLSLHEISRRAHICRRWTWQNLRTLESGGFITVDRTEKPFSYEVTARGWTTHS